MDGFALGTGAHLHLSLPAAAGKNRRLVGKRETLKRICSLLRSFLDYQALFGKLRLPSQGAVNLCSWRFVAFWLQHVTT